MEEEPYPTRTPYICIVGPTVHDSRWHNIEPSHDKTWLRCVRRITTQISLCICTVYSNKRLSLAASIVVHVIMVALSRNCKIAIRVVSKCSLLQRDVAHFCALARIIGQTEVVLISKDQKDRTVCVRLCVLLIETREFKAGRVRWIARERANLPDLYENTIYSVVVNE